jgi:tetratricopeptide (TPR) repeat protein
LAIIDFTKAIGLDPKYADAKTYYKRGTDYDSKGNYDLAIADCKDL